MYILECADGSYYTGSTKFLEKRLEQHQAGEGANHTKKHLPVKLVYYEEFERIDAAFSREKQAQGWSRKKKEALINNMPEKLHDLAKCMNETSHVGFDSTQPTNSAQPTKSAESTMKKASASLSLRKNQMNKTDTSSTTDAERSRSGSDNEIPNGWVETTLGEVCKIKN
ncbi:MAG: GIY-YIG nuclease family protein [Winogradskyella sp.]|nr:GIY-YIG nuclease family protein [Winogradskyella sp.]